MAIERKVISRFQFRRDNTENWTANKDTIPAPGEPCYDIDLQTLKIGDGKTTYEHLPLIGGVEIHENVIQLNESVTVLTEQIAEKVDASAVEALETDLKIYVDEQIKNVEVVNIDYGEI